MDLGCTVILSAPLAQPPKRSNIYTSSLSFVLQDMNADSHLVNGESVFVAWAPGYASTLASLCGFWWHSCKCFYDDRLLLPDRDERDRIRFLAGKARGGEGEWV